MQTKNKKIPVVKSFKFSVDFFYSDNVKIIKGMYGLAGVMAYQAIVCEIWRSGYFLEWNISTRYRIIDLVPELSSDRLDDIIGTLMEIGVFDADMFSQHAILTSSEIQTAYFKARKRRPDIDYPYIIESEPPLPSWAPSVEDIKEELSKNKIRNCGCEAPEIPVFHRFYTEHGWRDHSGRPVADWRSAFRLFIDNRMYVQYKDRYRDNHRRDNMRQACG